MQMADYEQIGMRAMLPGMQHMLSKIQEYVDEFRAKLEALENGIRPKRGRPARTDKGFLSMAGLKPGTEAYRIANRVNKQIERDQKRATGVVNSARSAGARGAWAGMTQEQRSAEMKRRMAVARAKKEAAKSRWKDGKSPAKVRWERMSARKRKEHLAKMAAARIAKQTAKHVNGVAA